MRDVRVRGTARLSVLGAVLLLGASEIGIAGAGDGGSRDSEPVPLSQLLAEKTVAAAVQGRSGSASRDIETERSAGEAHRFGRYAGRLVSRRSGKPIGGALLTFKMVDGDGQFSAETDEEGRYEVLMPMGKYRFEIQIGKKTYGGAGTFREEIAGKLWSLDFVISRKLTDQDFELEALPGRTRIEPVYVDRPDPDPHWAEFLAFIGAVAGIAAIAE